MSDALPPPVITRRASARATETRSWPPRWLDVRWGAPALALVLTGAGELAGWRGVDLPAQRYREWLFQTHGWAIWDPGWYGGHWTLDYSVISPALSALIGIPLLVVLSAGLAAWSFERLVAAAAIPRGAARAAAVVFAAGTVVQASIGQLPFLLGEGLGVAACWAATRRRWPAAVVLALLSALASPLAGAFLALAMVAWAGHTWIAGQRGAVWPLLAVAAGAVVAVGVPAGLFPGEGAMPYPFSDFGWELVIAAGLGLAAGRRHRLVRFGAATFALAATGAFFIPSPVGGNVGRMEDVLAVPVAVMLLWERPWWLAGVAVPLVLSQWTPAWAAITSNASRPSTHRDFYAPLIAQLRRAGGRPGRVEVVPTADHWEVDYVTPVMPLARGWERQIDMADNPIFYHRQLLTPTAYRHWLVGNGVRFVALPSAPIDFAGTAEAALVSRDPRVLGLVPVWANRDWRLYRVDGSSGIVGGRARLTSVSASGTDLTVTTPRAGPVLVRVRYEPGWAVTPGTGCVRRAPGGWTEVVAPRPESFVLSLHLVPVLGGPVAACPASSRG